MSSITRIALITVLLFTASVAAAAAFNWSTDAASGKLLPAARAFRLQAPTWAGKQLQLQWDIAPGYYLYRDRIKVHPAKTTGAAAGQLELPPAKAIEEAGIGEVHIYRNTLRARYVPKAGAATPNKLEVTVQGCADRGVCYPPMTQVVTLPHGPAHSSER